MGWASDFPAMIFRTMRVKWQFMAIFLAATVLVGRAAAEIRVGIIGLDSSHCGRFSELLNGNGPERIPGARIVAAYKGGSADIEASASRVDRFTNELAAKYDVEICASIDEVVAKVDAVMILSLDGRVHLEQARAVFPAGKPVFIDKPVAASVADAIAIFRLAEESGVPCFSSSTLRFGPEMEKVKATPLGRIQGAFAYGPARTEPHHPDLFWYGIHAVESLYTILGVGCETVVRTATPDTDIVTGTWSDGRTGTVRGSRNGGSASGLLVFGTKAVVVREPRSGYAPLVREIIKFFETGQPPVSPAETIEILAFMAAADESKRLGGKPVALRDVMVSPPRR